MAEKRALPLTPYSLRGEIRLPVRVHGVETGLVLGCGRDLAAYILPVDVGDGVSTSLRPVQFASGRNSARASISPARSVSPNACKIIAFSMSVLPLDDAG